MKNSYRHRKQRARRLRAALMLLCTAALLYGGVRLTQYALRAAATRRSDRAAQQIFEASPAPTDEAAPSLAEAAVPEEALPEETPVPGGVYQYIGSELLPNMAALRAENRDIVGWIKVPGEINLPVLYRDNEYYLNHDFQGEVIDSGAPFLDEYTPFTAFSQLLVVHGHNMFDGSMFSPLLQYRKSAYASQHGFLTFTTLFREETYLMLMACDVPGDADTPGFIPYNADARFDSETEFNAFIAVLGNAAVCRSPLDVRADDALLLLSTCRDDDRVVVLFRRMRDDETREGILQQLTNNMN